MGDLISDTLWKQASRAPVRAKGCLYGVLEQQWVGPEDVSKLTPEKRRFHLPGQFCCRKGRRVAACKRCGQMMLKGSIQIGYPSQKQNKIEPIWLHVRCAAFDEDLKCLAYEGKKVLKHALLGFDALDRDERKQLLEDIVEAVPPEPPALPAVCVPTALPAAVAPAGLEVELTATQREGLAWLLKSEEENQGGILADEMGMGKTVQIISLLCASELGPTLVVCPPSCTEQWRRELKERAPRALEVRSYMGARRSLPEDLHEKCVVLTSYSILEAEFRQQKESKHCEVCGDFLPCCCPRIKRLRAEQEPATETKALRRTWGRVVLDEAHRIRNGQGSTALAAMRLRALRRWAVTGTPMQNRISDLYPLLRFLRARPYGFYRCQKRNCDCECFTVRCVPDTELCNSCGHGRSAHHSIFKKEITLPILQYGFVEQGKSAMEALRVKILNRLMLRRTKACLDLPPMSIQVQHVELYASERVVYEQILKQSRSQVEEFILQGTLMKNFGHVFSIIMRQRQAANHPDLPKLAVNTDCPFCQCELLPGQSIQLCSRHSAHELCGLEVLRDLDGEDMACPLCLAPTVTGQSFLQVLQERGGVRSSSKIDALIKEVKELSKAERVKGLVFSQFFHFLQMVELHLCREGISCAIIAGKTSMKDRDRLIQHFASDEGPSLLLISLQVGGEGLNLQAANRVFLMDAWWNPAAEDQAMMRCHRMGQTKPVHVVRYIAANSIEERILKLQEGKQLTADSTIGGSNSALLKLTAEDIQLLFS